MSERFDAIVIGAGQAGPALCARLDKEGLKTALIERNILGGTCVNTGCIPTKTMIASGHEPLVHRKTTPLSIVSVCESNIDSVRMIGRMLAGI